jgi:hypothetical protein
MTINPDRPDELRRVLQEAERSQLSPTVRDLILREDSASVTINLWPQLIPRDSVDPNALLRAVEEEFRATLDTSALTQRIPAEARPGLTLATLLGHALKDDDVMVRFRGGFLTIPESKRITAIRSLVIGEQALKATVTGTSSEAEYCLRQLAIILSRAAGIERVWADFKPHVEMMSFSTSTVIDLGGSMARLLAPPVRQFLYEEVGGEAGFGAHMGGFASFDEELIRGVAVVPSVMRVEFVVNMMDSVSGRSERCHVELLSHTQSDNNRSRIKLVTELRSSDHQRFAERLVQAMHAAG